MSSRLRLLFGMLLCSTAVVSVLAVRSEEAAQAAPDQYGIAMVNGANDVVVNALSKLGVSWWYNYGSTPTNPTGANKVLLVRTNVPALSSADLQAMAATASPGAYWMIGNEPNVPGQDDVSPAAYAQLYNYYATAIKQLDPQAKLVAANILNWSTTCLNCGGFTSGQSWVAGFLQEYQNRYGGPPTVDVWGIHAYIIDWGSLPMVNSDLAVQQIDGLRAYLDSLPAQANKPIWLTEFGVIWGYPGLQVAPNDQCPQRRDCIAPTGDYRQEQITDYLRRMLSWLQTNSQGKRIARWFLFTHFGGPEPYATQYAGISLMNGPGGSADLSASGLVFREFAGGPLPPPVPPSPPPSSGGSGGSGGGPTPTPTATPSPTATPTPPATVANPTPALTSPPPGATLTSLSTTLSWTNPPGTTQYALQIIPFNNDGPGIDLVRNAESTYGLKGPDFGSAEANYVMLPDLGYAWRVRTTTVARPPQELTESDWSPWSAGAFRTPIKSSATVTLSTPGDGSTVSTTSPTLSWSNADREVFYYEVQVSRDPEFGPGAFLYWELRHGGVTTPPNSYAIPAQYLLERGTTYYWRVRPRIQGDGSPVAWTPNARFQVRS